MANHLKLEALRKIVDRWLDERSGNNRRLLSLRSGIPYSTLRRYLQGEAEISFSAAFKILNCVANLNETLIVLKDFFPYDYQSVGSLIEGFLATSPDNPYSSIDTELENALKKEPYFHVIGLASCNQGVSITEITEQLGDFGKKIVDELLAKEVLVMENGRLIVKKNWFVGMQDSILAVIQNSIDIFERSSNPTFAATRIEGVNSAGLSEVQSVLVEARDKVNALLARENLRGPIPISVGMVLGFLKTTQINFKSGQSNATEVIHV